MLRSNDLNRMKPVASRALQKGAGNVNASALLITADVEPISPRKGLCEV